MTARPVVTPGGITMPTNNRDARDMIARALPPPVALLVAGALMWLTQAYTAWPALAFRGQTVLVALVAVSGLALMIWAAVLFRRQRTTLNPLAPEETSGIVDAGPYRWSRNPMYVGDAVLLIAWGIYLGSALALIWIPAFVAWIHWQQIPREEATLARHFGDRYHRYCQQVRRWI